MTLQQVFNIGCGVVLCFSIYTYVFGAPRAADTTDPRQRLVTFLTTEGLELDKRRILPAEEELMLFRQPECAEPMAILYLPTIHRISDAARSIIASSDRHYFIHDRKVVGSLGPGTLAPRWLWARLLINLQLDEETPWPSIAIVVLQPDKCPGKSLAWERLQ